MLVLVPSLVGVIFVPCWFLSRETRVSGRETAPLSAQGTPRWVLLPWKTRGGGALGAFPCWADALGAWHLAVLPRAPSCERDFRVRGRRLQGMVTGLVSDRPSPYAIKVLQVRGLRLGIDLRGLGTTSQEVPGLLLISLTAVHGRVASFGSRSR